MNLTGKQLVEQGIITGEILEENIQQVGVDLNLIAVEAILGPGFIPKASKTKLATRRRVTPIDKEIDGQMYKVWELGVGVYDITLKQGCKIPANQRLRIVQRSSMLRNGVILSSSIFDPGFVTEAMGTVMLVNEPVFIEVGARIAQAYVSETNQVENLYNGQFQNDNQRKTI